MASSDILIKSSILHRATSKYYDKKLEDYNIGYGQILFLMMIYEREGITMKELSHYGAFDKGTTTKGINKLESIGYVRLEENPQDKRSKLIYTTEKAKDIISVMYLLRKEWWEHLTQNIDVEHQELFSSLLDQVVENALKEKNDSTIKIYGMQKLSLFDYPQLLSTKLMTGGCNFRCPYCHNKNLVFLPESIKDIELDEIYKHLKQRKNLIKGVCISGGEPLLHNDLEPLLKRIKEMGYLIKIDTNGMFPERLQDLVNKHLVDYVAVDVKNTPEKYEETAGIDDFNEEIFNKTIQFLLNNEIDYEFRTTIVKEYHNVEDIGKIAQWIKGAKAYYLQAYRGSDNVINPHLNSVDKEVLEKMKEVAQRYIKNVEIRGI